MTIELSAREAEVLRLVADGLLNKQIAYRLGLKEHTIKKYLHNVYHKLGANNRTQAAFMLHDVTHFSTH